MARGRSVEKALRRAKALQLKLAGYTYARIAQELGIHESQVYKDVQQAIRQYTEEPAREVREQELARLDGLLTSLWYKATTGDMFAVDRVIKIMERRAKLLGLDAPPQVTLEVYAREVAYRDGYDPEEFIQECERIAEHAGLQK